MAEKIISEKYATITVRDLSNIFEKIIENK
jgi:hypothetical protein